MGEELPSVAPNEEPYRRIVHASPDAIMICSGEEIVYANPAAAELLGAGSPADIVGLRALDIVHPAHREAVRALMAEVEAGRAASTTEEKFVRLDGKTIDVEVMRMPFAYRGKPARQIVVRDIRTHKAIERKLRETEKRLRAVVETIPAVVYLEVAGEGFAPLYISPQVERILGLSEAEYASDPNYWEQHLHPADRERAVRAYHEFVHGDSDSLIQEYRMITRDGRIIWCQDRSVVLRDSEPPLVQGVMFDVTERKLAEEGLKRRDAILQVVDFVAQTLLRSADWHEVIDDVLRILGEAAEANSVGIWESSLTPDGSPLSTLTHEWVATGMSSRIDDPALKTGPLDEAWAGWVADMRAGRPVFGLAKNRPESERDWYAKMGMVSIVNVPVFVDGEWWGIVGFEDSDERDWPAGEIEALEAAAGTLGAAISRQHTEQQLRDTESRYRALVERISAVLYVDKPSENDRTIYVSPQVKEILGLSAEDWIAQSDLWYRHLHPEDQVGALATYRGGVASQKPFSFEYRMNTPRGMVWIRDDAVVLTGDDGLPIVQGVMFDVTEHKLAEQALLESEQREREAAARLRQLDEMKNTFLAAVSHELRSPLTAVLGLALTLERGVQGLSEEDSKDLLHRLAENARKLERLLVDLLDIDRLSRGAATLQWHTTDVGALVRCTVGAADYLGGRTVKVEAEPVIASVDGAKVERIVENLLVNAARHTAEDTTVWVRVAPYEDGVLITVEDDGPGLSDELKPVVFEAFQQGPTEASHSPGTGIGLALVAQFARLHGGQAWVEDREGGGASFKVYIPNEGYGQMPT